MEAASAPTTDAVQFFRAWMRDPLRVASVTPSSPALAGLMVTEIGAHTGSVIELGPGTGVFTRALLDRGVAEENLILVEKGAEFAAMLRMRFPQAKVLCADAAALGRADLPSDAPIGAVVSGLPLLSMKPRTVFAILAGAFARLREGGAFYQFTYGPRCPVPLPVLARLGLKATRVGHTYRNFPPATVYRLSRRPVPAATIAAIAASRREIATVA
jgi:phosphatidylethanolamine/phosphatidyl-N-methylethanolamine N-methyltransferase